MTQQTEQQQTSTSHFDAAKVIVETLQKLDRTSQVLAMRFASETLGLQAPLIVQPPLAQAASPLSPPNLPGGNEPIHSSDIKQFSIAKAPKSDLQFAAVVAYFYRFEAPEPQRKDAIDAENLLEAARLAGRKRPTSPVDTLNNAKRAGYLDSATAGKFQINSVGENLVAMALPGNGPKIRNSSDRGISKKKTRVKETTKSTVKATKPRK